MTTHHETLLTSRKPRQDWISKEGHLGGEPGCTTREPDLPRALGLIIPNSAQDRDWSCSHSGRSLSSLTHADCAAFSWDQIGTNILNCPKVTQAQSCAKASKGSVWNHLLLRAHTAHTPKCPEYHSAAERSKERTSRVATLD